LFTPNEVNDSPAGTGDHLAFDVVANASPFNVGGRQSSPPTLPVVREVDLCWLQSYRAELDRRVALLKTPNFDSAQHWEDRYKTGGNSGGGSYGASARHKASVINAVVRERGIRSAIEFGVGDGANQALYTDIPAYIGVDVSPTTVERVRRKYGGDPTRTFVHYDTFTPLGGRADMAMSLDVIYHLIEPSVYVTYLDNLFGAAESDVLIFAVDEEKPEGWGYHYLPRKFTPYVAVMFPCWELRRVYDLCDGCESVMHHFVRAENCFEKKKPCLLGGALKPTTEVLGNRTFTI
ncbi:hypothetical protein THAOC_16403, partial [Thalassiosira oceanica]